MHISAMNVRIMIQKNKVITDKIGNHRNEWSDYHSCYAISLLEKSLGDNTEEESNLDLFSLEMFENIAFIMAKHADPSIPDEVEDWLDEFNTFSIYQVLPQLIELWGMNIKTDAEAKKNFVQQSVK